MKQLFMSVLTKPLIAMLFLSFLGLLSFNSFAEEAIETGTFNNKAIYGYDPVAYFTDGKPEKGKNDYVFSWRGADWYFASAEHKALFEAAPEKYAPQYGGHCSYAMAEGRFVGVDVDAFSIFNGKLYLNYSKKYRAKWLANKADFISRADAQYTKEINP